MGNRRLAWQRVELGQRPGGLEKNRLCGKVGKGEGTTHGFFRNAVSSRMHVGNGEPYKVFDQLSTLSIAKPPAPFSQVWR